MKLKAAFRAAPALVSIPAVLAALYAWAAFATVFFHPGLIGPNWNAPGTDWMVMYAAGDAARTGHLPIVLDGVRFTGHLNVMFAQWLTLPLEFRPWVYPPSFLLILAPLSYLGFIGSFFAFQALSAGLTVAALRYRADQPGAAGWIALAAVISPAAATNAVAGQCGLLVAALLIGIFRLVAIRPLVAGVLLGLLTFKPQFCLLAPVALIALRQWRCLGAAGLTIIVLFAVSAALFGPDAWIAWAREAWRGYAGQDRNWIQYGRLWGDSVYTCALLLGAPMALASGLQTAAVLAGAATIYAVFRSKLAADQKLAVLLTATLFAAPHSAIYDKDLLVVAAGLWLAAGANPWPLWKAALALILWLSPLIGPPVWFPVSRFAPLVLIGFMAAIVLNANRAATKSSTI